MTHLCVFSRLQNGNHLGLHVRVQRQLGDDELRLELADKIHLRGSTKKRNTCVRNSCGLGRARMDVCTQHASRSLTVAMRRASSLMRWAANA